MTTSDEAAWLRRRLDTVLASRQVVYDRLVTIELARVAEYCREHTGPEIRAHIRGRIAEIRGQVAS